jgi:hypothetical protein
MSAGTAMIILGVLYLTARFEAFRIFLFVIFGLGLGGLWWLIDFGADKPQTFFYNSQAHPAFLVHSGDTCPSDRHIWNHWCIK